MYAVDKQLYIRASHLTLNIAKISEERYNERDTVSEIVYQK